MLRPYVQGLDYSQYLQKKVGYATSTIVRNDPAGGDSPLGNIVTDAMMNHELARAQLCVTNSMGIRADISTPTLTFSLTTTPILVIPTQMATPTPILVTPTQMLVTPTLKKA